MTKRREKREGGRVEDDKVAGGWWRNREEHEHRGINEPKGNKFFIKTTSSFVSYN